MPIIEPPDESSELSQADVLKDVSLFTTREPWSGKGGEAAPSGYRLCLVLSRPCVASHKSVIIVAGIERYSGNPPKDLDTFGKVLLFLTRLRDGVGSPDQFYLGQLPGKQGRFCARFDALFTVQLPPEQEQRRAFLRSHRVGRLNPDFARDVHVRLFAAFASLGFDDERWLSTEDLKWLVSQGEADTKKLEAELARAESQVRSREAAGQQASDKDASRIGGTLDELAARVEPFKRELGVRQQEERD